MLKRILTGALVVGIVDLADAFLFFYFRSGTSPVRILQSIAAGAGAAGLQRWHHIGGAQAAASLHRGLSASSPSARSW